MLRNQNVPEIGRITGNNFERSWFQQSGGPPHVSRVVRTYLNDEFPMRWLGRRRTIE